MECWSVTDVGSTGRVGILKRLGVVQQGNSHQNGSMFDLLMSADVDKDNQLNNIIYAFVRKITKYQ